MQGIREYIIEIKETYKDSIKTNSGFKLYLDKRFNGRELGATTGKVIAIPKLEETPIKPGDFVAFDNSFLIQQVYNKQVQGILNIADKEKNRFFITSDLICLYSGDKKTWRGFGKNVLVEPIAYNLEDKKGLIMSIDETKQKHEKGKAKICFLNNYLEEEDVSIGDIVFLKKGRDLEFKFNDKTYWLVRNHDILAVEN